MTVSTLCLNPIVRDISQNWPVMLQIDTETNRTIDSIRDKQAMFGPDFPKDGIDVSGVCDSLSSSSSSCSPSSSCLSLSSLSSCVIIFHTEGFQRWDGELSIPCRIAVNYIQEKEHALGRKTSRCLMMGLFSTGSIAVCDSP